ncbi:chorismate--pyruvate lyase family protein [Hydromonas duriensis]|uniref:Probable chorismate pyruvate-lyase n=1 Tax=Hydromonas duriensis TaxID=1527608 RepID=A0A4R6Y0G9_9BURK|nr:chorismate lyase [Hydromonas duriensis]TDR28842.1 chorismate lyase [Hydromonas duriensis]
MSSSLHSPWQRHVPQIQRKHQHWLTDTGSLTQKLKNHCEQFVVQRVRQNRAFLNLSETKSLCLPLGRRILQRQVLLICDDSPVVFAHTVTALERAGRDWPFFNQLGNRALGLTLFANPLVCRSDFEYTRICAQDALYQIAQTALHTHHFKVNLPRHIWARRCLFQHVRHQNSRMMVTELMLPEIYQLEKTSKAR